MNTSREYHQYNNQKALDETNTTKINEEYSFTHENLMLHEMFNIE
jgi:hypothetical protein